MFPKAFISRFLGELVCTLYLQVFRGLEVDRMYRSSHVFHHRLASKSKVNLEILETWKSREILLDLEK